MPDALRIVPPILVEVIEDEKEGNGMEIDSGNGRDSSDTLAAGVQCLLQCLNPATAESGDGKFFLFLFFFGSFLFLSSHTRPFPDFHFPFIPVICVYFYFYPFFFLPIVSPWRLASAAG